MNNTATKVVCFVLLPVLFIRFERLSTWKTMHLCFQLELTELILLHLYFYIHLWSRDTVLQNRHLDSVLSNHLSIKVQEENNTLQSMDMIRPLQYQQKEKKWSKHDLGEQIEKTFFCLFCSHIISIPLYKTKMRFRYKAWAMGS